MRERHKKGGERERPRRPEQSETQRDAVCEGGDSVETASGMRWDALVACVRAPHVHAVDAKGLGRCDLTLLESADVVSLCSLLQSRSFAKWQEGGW